MMQDESVTSIYKIKDEEIERMEQNSINWKENQNGLLSNQSLVCAAKRAIFGEKSQKMTFEQNCQVLDYIIKNVLEIDEATFYNIYNSATLIRLRLRNLTSLIIKMAPEDLKLRCVYNNKRILFASVYPDFYKKNFAPIQSEDIYNCSGDVKSSLKKAAGIKLSSIRDGEDVLEETTKDGMYKTERGSQAKGLHGTEVDKLLFNTLNEMMEMGGFISYKSKLNFIAGVKSFYSNLGTSLPGIYSVIDSRGCYDSYLDFFFLNSDPQKQKYYFSDFMEYRSKYQEDNELLNEIYEVYLEDYIQ